MAGAASFMRRRSFELTIASVEASAFAYERFGDIPLPGSRAAWIAGAAAEPLRGDQPGSARVRPALLAATRTAESAMELSLKEWAGERPSPWPYQGMVSPS